MKKIVFTLAAGIIFAWQGLGLAATTGVDSLIQKLEDKGILTNEEAAQIKGEIVSDQKSSQEATFKSMIPDWVNGLKISGDFRFRDQLQVRKVPGGLSGQSGDNFDQNRARIRARVNFEDQINDKVKVVIGLATDGGTARSNNYTLGGNKAGGTAIVGQDAFGKPAPVLNKAYAVYTPNDMITVMGGKLDNPVWEPAGSSFLWDPDITPEGGSIQLQKKLNDYITPWVSGDVFVLHDLTPSNNTSTSTKTDPYMIVSQGGIKGNLTEQVYYKAGVTWYDIGNPNRITFGEGLGTNSIIAGSSYALSHLMYNFNDVIVEGADIGINDPFGELLPSPINIAQVGVFGDFAENNSNNSLNATVTAKNTQNKAWEMGGYMGNSAINGWGTWKLQSCYKVLERDSWLDALPDDDFYSGYTDTKGWRTQMDIGLAKNVWFTMTYFRTSPFKYISSIPGLTLVSSSNNSAAFSKDAPENLFQMDLNFKF